MAKGHRKPNSERVVDTDVLADHRESCVEKAQASGEPCALKGASTVREGAVGKGLSSGYHLEVQAGRNGISTSLAAYFILFRVARTPLSEPVRAVCSGIRLSTSPEYLLLSSRDSISTSHFPLRCSSGSASTLPPRQVGFQGRYRLLSLCRYYRRLPAQQSANAITASR